MNHYSLIGLFFIINYASCGNIPFEEYLLLRNGLVQEEESTMIGSDLLLDQLEIMANNILMDFKSREYKEGLASNGDYFAAAKHYFQAMKEIEASNVFKIIRILPKGAALHMHDSTVGSAEYVARNLSKWENLYYCGNFGEHLLFHFFSEPPKTKNCGVPPNEACCEWTLVQNLRNNASSSGHIDDYFIRSMSMVTNNPEVEYTDTDNAWLAFETKITTINGIVNYEKAYKEFYRKTLEEFYDDNVMYIEMRGLLDMVYRLDGTILEPIEVIQLYKEATEEFMLEHPDFMGAKFIYAPHRFNSIEEIEFKLNEAIEMKMVYPNDFAGFDLVGQEDKGGPLLQFAEKLLSAREQGLNFFFHAGETDWRGTAVDENLFDAVLLNTTRIGHGYALASLPHLTKMVAERGIGVEICPISNQVLNLVKDLRNHPAKAFLRKGFPAVIASDGPGIWGSRGLSHDFYYAFMGLGGARADLKFIKQLAINSILYSSMSPVEKESALTRWRESWAKAIAAIVEMFEPSKVASSSLANEIPKVKGQTNIFYYTAVIAEAQPKNTFYRF